MNGIQFDHCTIGTVSSREDGSIVFRVSTAELRPSERGLAMEYHGKACCVAIIPQEGDPNNLVRVTTEKGELTPAQRLYKIIYAHFKQQDEVTDPDTFYRQAMNRICEGYKSKNLNP